MRKMLLAFLMLPFVQTAASAQAAGRCGGKGVLGSGSAQSNGLQGLSRPQR